MEKRQVDIVRVLRVIEYVGPRDAVESQLAVSLHGQRHGLLSPTTGQPVVIRAATLGLYPEILDAFEAGVSEVVHPESICAMGERCTCDDPSPKRCNAFKDASAMPRRFNRPED